MSSKAFHAPETREGQDRLGCRPHLNPRLLATLRIHAHVPAATAATSPVTPSRLPPLELLELLPPLPLPLLPPIIG